MHSAKKYSLKLHIILSCIAVIFCQLVFSQGVEDRNSLPDNHSAINLADTSATADTVSHAVIVRDIILEGNNKTRPVLIYRELTIKKGDTIYTSDLPKLFEESEKRLRNLSLFHENEIKISVLRVEENFIDIKIVVHERNYIFIFPHLKPIDRNISQWLFKEKASFSRVDYGVKIMLDNVTGNNDKVRLYFINGYTRQLMLSYRRPFIDKNMKWGIGADLSFGKNHEINYNTIDDKQVYLKLKDKNYAKNFFNASVEFTYRPEYYTWHSFGLDYNYLRVHDSVLIKNPNFFLRPGVNKVSYPVLYYKFNYRNLDFNPYPTKGYASEIELSRLGLGRDVNLTQLTAKGIGYWPLGKKSFYSLGASGMIKVPFRQPYYTSQLLGYGDLYLRGYEFYVMDGVAGGLIQSTVAQQIANFSLHIPRTKWLTPRMVPLRIYAKLHGNMGYVYNPNPGNNQLLNKMLFGSGVGIDIVTMYDFNLKIDFSFNQLGQNGIYLQKKSTFQ